MTENSILLEISIFLWSFSMLYWEELHCHGVNRITEPTYLASNREWSPAGVNLASNQMGEFRGRSFPVRAVG